MKASERPRAGVPGRVFTPTPAEILAVVAIAGLAGLLLLPSVLRDPEPVLGGRAAFAYRVDVRTAGEGELILLPGVGPHRARRIVRARGEAPAGATPLEILEAAGLPADVRRRLEPWIRPGGED